MNQIETFLRTQIDPSNKALFKAVMDVAYIRNMKKGDYLIECGERPTGLWFLISGLFRGYFLDHQGNEVTDCISFRYGSTLMPSADYINLPSTERKYRWKRGPGLRVFSH